MNVRSEINRWFSNLTLLVLCVFLCAGTALAQTVTGSIYGTVTDATGAVVSGAAVSVVNVNTGETHANQSDASGNYTFLTLVPGEYKVSAKNAGFTSQNQQVRLDANQNVHANFALQAGESTQVVTVEAGASMVDTRESQIAFTVDQRRIEDLPTNGRNAYDLVQITPGVTNYVQDADTGTRAGTQLAVNGVSANNTAFYLDGAYNTNVWQFGGNLLPNPDALEEFRVLTSNVDAEFGRSPSVVSAITRSGTNDYHGLVFEYLRNTAFNAKKYTDSTKSPLHRNQFGANFGGPLWPSLHDKAFFFLTYQGVRQHSPANVSTTEILVPTELERKGDFSASPVIPTTLPAGTNCGTLTAPVLCAIDPVAKSLLAFVPVGDSTPGSNYGRPLQQQSANADVRADQGMIRLDYQLNPQHRIAGMFFESRGTSNNPKAASNDGTYNQIVSYAGMTNYEGQYNAVASDTWTISANKVNDFRAYYSLNHYIIANTYGDSHFLPELGSQAAMGGNYNAQPFFSVAGYWNMGTKNAGPNNLPSTTMGGSDTFNWTLGRHELKMGGAYIWDRFGSTGGGSSNGLFTVTAATTHLALADFLLGKANNLVQNNGVNFRSHSQDPSAFIQDNWKLSQRLTLNLGLRWEYYPMYTGQNNTGTFVQGRQSQRFPTAPLGLVFAGEPGIPDGIFHTPWNTFAPRIGFAYDVFGNGKTAVRGAYGLFYAAIDQVAISNNLVQQPFSRNVTMPSTKNFVCPYGGTPISLGGSCPEGTTAGTDPFPYLLSPTNSVFLPGATIFSMNPGAKNVPSVQQFNLTVEQQFSPKWSSQLSYVGNVTRHFYVTRDINAPLNNPSCTIATCTGNNTTLGSIINSRRPIQVQVTAPPSPTYTYGAINEVDPIGNSSYHSMQAVLKRQFGNGFSVQASYVWSKTMGYGAPVDVRDISSSRGLLNIDTRNYFIASYIWQLPKVHRFGVLGREVLSGWQLNGITTLHSGSPFNVVSNSDTNEDGNTATDRPNVVGNPYLSHDRSHAQMRVAYFNRLAFATPSGTGTGLYGNAPFDFMIGPGYANTDLSAFKKFALYRRSALEFRAEAFNLFNRVNFNNPNGSVSTAAGGSIGTTSAARIMQFALRLSF